MSVADVYAKHRYALCRMTESPIGSRQRVRWIGICRVYEQMKNALTAVTVESV